MKLVLSFMLFFATVLPLSAVGKGDMAPQISGPDKDGRTIRLSDFRGKVVMVEFWASWCGPCRAAMPKTWAKQKKYGSRGFAVFAVSLNRRKGSDIRYMKRLGYKFKAMIYTGGNIPAAYGIRGIPHAILIGKDGKIIWRGHPYSLTDSMIEKALGGSADDSKNKPDPDDKSAWKTKAAVFAKGNSNGPKLIGGMQYYSRGVLHTMRRSNFWGKWKYVRIGIIKYKRGYMNFTFKGKQNFTMMLAGGAIAGRSQCRIAVYVNGRKITGGFFLNQWWNYYHIPASSFSNGINKVRIVNVSRSVPWVYRAWTDAKLHSKSKEIK